MDEAPATTETSEAGIDAPDPSEGDRVALSKVASILRTLRYGTILLVIHDGEVVQIEAAEKIRMR